MASRAKSMMGGGHSDKKKSGKKPHSIHIRRGKSGGFIATHHHVPKPGEMSAEPDEDHVVPDLESLHDHIDQNMGDQGAAGEQEAEPTAPAPAPQGPPPTAQ